MPTEVTFVETWNVHMGNEMPSEWFRPQIIDSINKWYRMNKVIPVSDPVVRENRMVVNVTGAPDWVDKYLVSVPQTVSLERPDRYQRRCLLTMTMHTCSM